MPSTSLRALKALIVLHKPQEKKEERTNTYSHHSPPRPSGIQGGFVPPKPSAIHEIKCADDTGVTIDTHVRPEGSRDLHGPTTKTIDADAHGSAVDALIGELEGILQAIPQSDERSADIYGLDIGIFFGSDQVQWRNGASEGCDAGSAEDGGPSEAQKDKFKRAVEISEELVALGAAEGN